MPEPGEEGYQEAIPSVKHIACTMVAAKQQGNMGHFECAAIDAEGKMLADLEKLSKISGSISSVSFKDNKVDVSVRESTNAHIRDFSQGKDVLFGDKVYYGGMYFYDKNKLR